MAEQAAHLVDAVLPRVPVRQWVLSLPFELRFRLAWDHRLLTEVLGVALRTILAFQRRRARRELRVKGGECGAVTVVQRFGSALNANIHFHAIVLDGVHVQDVDGGVRFHALRAPSEWQRLVLTARIALRVRRLLKGRGLLLEEPPSEEVAPDAFVATCQAASARGVVASGPRAGRPVARIRLPRFAREALRPGQAVAGFDLHVGPVVHARDRKRLERLSRHLLRPALSSARLRLLDDGRVRYDLLHPWRDGTTAIVLSGPELLERLVALVPAPRRHLLRYHGTLAPNHRWRARIVPRPSARSRERSACTGHGCDGQVQGLEGGAASRPGRLSWAELRRRVFGSDLSCPRCGAAMKVVASVDDPDAVRAILEHLGLSARPPPLTPARHGQLDGEGG